MNRRDTKYSHQTELAKEPLEKYINASTYQPTKNVQLK